MWWRGGCSLSARRSVRRSRVVVVVVVEEEPEEEGEKEEEEQEQSWAALEARPLERREVHARYP